MNTIEEGVKGLALQAAAAKFATTPDSGGIDQIETWAAELELGIMKLVASIGLQGDEQPTKPARKPRAPVSNPTGSAPTGAASVTPGDISRALAGGEKLSLQGLAAKLEATTGKVGRALAALGSAVKSEPGINPPGKRGKAPVVYFLA